MTTDQNAKKMDLERIKALCEQARMAAADQSWDGYIPTVFGACVEAIPLLVAEVEKTRTLLADACRAFNQINDELNHQLQQTQADFGEMQHRLETERDAARALAERCRKALEPLVNADVRGARILGDGRLLGVYRAEINEAKAAHDAALVEFEAESKAEDDLSAQVKILEDQSEQWMTRCQTAEHDRDAARALALEMAIAANAAGEAEESTKAERERVRAALDTIFTQPWAKAAHDAKEW